MCVCQKGAPRPTAHLLSQGQQQQEANCSRCHGDHNTFENLRRNSMARNAVSGFSPHRHGQSDAKLPTSSSKQCGARHQCKVHWRCAQA